MPVEIDLPKNHLIDVRSTGKKGQALVIQTGRGGAVRTKKISVLPGEQLVLETEAWEHNKKHQKGPKPTTKGLPENFTIPRE